MQITLDAVDWEQLTSFGSPEAFFEWYYELENEDDFRTISCYDNGWLSDSAIQYFEVAEVLQHLASISDPETSAHLDRGIRRLLAENGHVDEFGMAEPSEGNYWISASPSAVREIKAHIDALDRARCAETLRRQPPSGGEDVMNDLDGTLFAWIDQHSRIVDVAASNGYGLLGHCG